MTHFKRLYVTAALTLAAVQVFAPSAASQSATKPASDGVAEGPPIAGDITEGRNLKSAPGMQVRTRSEETIGRIIDLLTDRNGNVEAAVIELGGFLGIGTRKVAVEWPALLFERKDKSAFAVLDVTREQLQVAPEYKPGQPAVVIRINRLASSPTEQPLETVAKPAPALRRPEGDPHR